MMTLQLRIKKILVFFIPKKTEEKLITVTPKGSNTLKTNCRKRRATSLLKLNEECENSAEKKIKVSTIEELIFIVTF